jgi:hypothetical protein
MKISPVSGSIQFASATLDAHLSLPRFLDSALGQSAQAKVIDQARRQYQLVPEPGVRATVFFNGGLIDRILLMMSIPSDSAGVWTEPRERERKALHDEWLVSELGRPPYDFPWGRVVSDFDPRGCASEIIVAYDR